MGRHLVLAEIMPPFYGEDVRDDDIRNLAVLSQYFSGFTIVTKPHGKCRRMDSIEFFRRVNGLGGVDNFEDAVVHYAVGRRKEREIREDLDRASGAGVRHLLILGGDYPKEWGKRKLPASDAIGIAKFDYAFTVGAALNQHAVYPDDPVCGEFKRLADKIRAGTDHISLQPTAYIGRTDAFLDSARRYLHEQDLDLPPVVDGVMFFDTPDGMNRARDVFGIPVSGEMEREVMKHGSSVRSGLEIYEGLLGDGRHAVYFTPFSHDQYGLLNRILAEVKKDQGFEPACAARALGGTGSRDVL
jgi:5,10-methylenetetrahydrofolate reductase